ncbi:hypothetical protein NLU13_2307 [Sarocladium strictum]|uniref:Autophagy-related protein 11 n=1 Tax=Sarocladium strictum TaxID=5046 RepID=A0AA39GSL4_SARSR|nr:hypothetical protein NLU13_2307 [Sarocladium strictum]
MATQVLIAHTGQRLECDTTQFSSLDDLKSWVSENSSISAQHVVALTSQGRSVKLASLHGEKEIFIYDIRITQPSSSKDAPSLVSKTPMPRPYSVPTAPNSIEDATAIGSWQSLYKERRAWALRLADDCSKLSQSAQERYDEIDVMVKCLDAAVANLEISVKQIEPKYAELKKWVTPALEEHEQLVSGLQQYLELAKRTAVSPVMVHFMTRGEVDKTEPTLEDLVEMDTAKKAGKLAPTAKKRFSDKAAELDKANEQMYQGLEGLIANFEGLMAKSFLGHSEDAPQLLEDIEAVVRQIDSDYRTALAYGSSQRDVAQASKTASNHTERLVPNLKKRAKELDDMLRYATQARNTVAAESVEFMRVITDITLLHSNVKNQINVLNQSEDDMTTFDYLRLIHQLPYMYASFLVEAIRRKDWVDKVKTDSSTLANEMALFQDEEAKRRKKWQKMVGSMYGPSLDTNVVGLEVNLLGEDTPWPTADKSELEQYIQALQSLQVDQAVLGDVMSLVEELNAPTKQQSKRVKAFKNGSVHDAALGRSGLMIRGDDELLRSLQDDKGKLETRLKTAESRVRRLEDLLHRQSQASRPNNLFQPGMQQQQQQRERHNSTSSNRSNRLDDRRRSSDGADPLLRRIAQLENELREEKQRAVRAQKDLTTQSAQHDGMRSQIEEANSTKKDLLENMEALKREFDVERKHLEDEVKTLKARLEDTEDEIDHFGASRENEKASYDEKVQALEAELEQHKKDRQDETLKAQGQVDFLRNETRMLRGRVEAQDRELQSGQEEARNLAKKLQSTKEASEVQMEALKKVFGILDPAASVPEDTMDLADALQTLAADVLEKSANADKNLSLLRAELEQAQNSTNDLRNEANDVKRRLTAEEEANLHLRETISEQRAKAENLDKEVAESREQLSSLRKQLSDGETGSETLQKRLEETEDRVASLTEQLASRQSQVGSLEEELHLVREKLGASERKLSEVSERYEERDRRTKDLTQRVYSQNDRLCRLLEKIGYAVARKDGDMSITKVSRSERTSQNPNDSSDPGTSIRRSTTVGSRSMHDSTDLDLLYWMKADNPTSEVEKYDAFINSLGHFNVDLFSETVYQRIKDTERKARKWQHDLRASREKAHIAQKDAWEKIAFKHFKEGDLALFLPTRNQQAGAWAAFNVGFPHYFLREQDAHRLRHREWLVARITRIQERVVDLSKSLQPGNETDSINTEENDNPFQLSDGLRWYLIDAHEDKPGAPATPGMGKSTVATNTVEATASIRTHAASGRGKNRDSITSIEGINKTLSKSLDSRRSSTGSKKALPFAGAGGASLLKGNALSSETNSLRVAAPETPLGTSPTQAGVLSSKKGPLASNEQKAQPDSGKEGAEQASAAAKTTTAVQQDDGKNAEQQQQTRRTMHREESTGSPSKRSVVWDPLWSVDYTYESSPSKK